MPAAGMNIPVDTNGAVPTDWAADLTTRSGVRLHVRPTLASDKRLLAELFSHVSAEDLRFRFFETSKQVGEDQIAAMLDVEGGIMTFLALDNETPVACCTLADDSDGKSADVALSVRSDRKGSGISWTLLEHVLEYAAAHGLSSVSSLESGDDRLAIALEREMGFVARLSSASPIELTLSKRIGER